ncbi:antitoxin YefM [Pseudomonas delhiensis]|uniref:Antitoxin YefM n=1 Tax=Pseudomonas delhiensis TaxID=366289 RepID=A0A239HUK4_9PSED|nr:antitoxin YefM [Pseudomonas delhiensis]SNS85016.1 hypothetical protein SAMN06295949_10899 [Pseudomonas delhiensis]
MRLMDRLDDFNSLVETFHLLRSPANAAHLARSLAQMEAGKPSRRKRTRKGDKGSR